MKVAITGKGGVGKSTFAANFARYLTMNNNNNDFSVLAVDADPDASLGTILGIPDEVLTQLKPIVEMKELIEERMGGPGAYYPLNPRVDDIIHEYSIEHNGIRFFRMGNVKNGGSTCYCKENSFLNALVNCLILGDKDTVILDMGAGIEQLTRGTAYGMDALVILTEPTKVSIQTVQIIKKLAHDLGIHKVMVVGNKVRNEKETEFLKSHLKGDLVGVIPYSEELIEMSLFPDIRQFPTGLLGLMLQQIYQKIINEGKH